jgi:hypothetical protein
MSTADITCRVHCRIAGLQSIIQQQLSVRINLNSSGGQLQILQWRTSAGGDQNPVTLDGDGLCAGLHNDLANVVPDRDGHGSGLQQESDAVTFNQLLLQQF